MRPSNFKFIVLFFAAVAVVACDNENQDGDTRHKFIKQAPDRSEVLPADEGTEAETETDAGATTEEPEPQEPIGQQPTPSTGSPDGQDPSAGTNAPATSPPSSQLPPPEPDSTSQTEELVAPAPSDEGKPPVPENEFSNQHLGSVPLPAREDDAGSTSEQERAEVTEVVEPPQQQRPDYNAQTLTDEIQRLGLDLRVFLANGEYQKFLSPGGKDPKFTNALIEIILSSQPDPSRDKDLREIAMALLAMSDPAAFADQMQQAFLLKKPDEKERQLAPALYILQELGKHSSEAGTTPFTTPEGQFTYDYSKILQKALSLKLPSNVQAMAITALAHSWKPSFEKKILAYLQDDKHARITVAALYALDQNYSDSIDTALLQVLEAHPSSWHRQGITMLLFRPAPGSESLEKTLSPDAAQILAERLRQDEPDYDIRELIIAQSRYLSDPPEILVDAIKYAGSNDPSMPVRRAADLFLYFYRP